MYECFLLWIRILKGYGDGYCKDLSIGLIFIKIDVFGNNMYVII